MCIGVIDCVTTQDTAWLNRLLLRESSHFFIYPFILIHENHTLFIQKINTFLSSCGGAPGPPFLFLPLLMVMLQPH